VLDDLMTEQKNFCQISAIGESLGCWDWSELISHMALLVLGATT